MTPQIASIPKSRVEDGNEIANMLPLERNLVFMSMFSEVQEHKEQVNEKSSRCNITSPTPEANGSSRNIELRKVLLVCEDQKPKQTRKKKGFDYALSKCNIEVEG
jgi:hypothetical protein